MSSSPPNSTPPALGTTASEPAPPRPSTGSLLAAFAAVYLIWGSTYLAIRIALEGLPPFWMAGVRFLVAGSLLYGFFALRGSHKPSLLQWRNALIVGVLLLSCSNGLVVYAEQSVSSGLAALLVSLLPLWMVLLEWKLCGGRAPGPLVLVGLVLGAGGVALLAGLGESQAALELDPSGLVALLIAPMTWALGSILGRKLDLPKSAFQSTAMQMLCGGAVLMLLSLVLREGTHFELAEVSRASWWALLYLISLGSLVGLTAYVWLLQVSTPARVSTYAYVNPVVAVFLGWALAGEELNGNVALAAALILGAVVLLTSWRSKVPG